MNDENHEIFKRVVIEHDLLDVEKFLEAKEMISIATTRFYLEKIGKPSPKFDFTSQIQRVKELLRQNNRLMLMKLLNVLNLNLGISLYTPM